jgi:solute carrier family 30 (zinc transporter), member 2
MENHNPLHSQIAEVKMDISASASVAAGNKFCKGAAYYFSDSSNSSKDAKERSTSMRKLIITVILCIIFMMVEVVGGIKANSLAILTDATHLLSDVAAFAITVILFLGCWMGSNTTAVIWVLLD